MSIIERRTAENLARIAAAGLTRRSPAVSDRNGVRYCVGGRPVIGLCSNDYLDLADTPAAVTVAGSGGSRLICGDLAAHRDVERRLAALAGADDAVLFPSGYQLNVGVLPALIEAGDRVYSDALNHASLIDGLRLARVHATIVPHLCAPPNDESSSTTGAAWWITESTFSMDGDLVDVAAVARHLAQGGATYVDEAHSIGLYEGGRGLLAHAGIVATASIGPLGKAFGTAGAFVAASDTLCRWIRTRARSFVFSTGISPAVTQSIAAAIDIVSGDEGDRRRARLWRNVATLAELLNVEAAASPIFPVVIGGNDDTVSIAASLLERGWHVQAIRPPTVPEGSARLRVTVSAGHDESMLVAFARDLRELLASRETPLRIERGVGPT